MKKTIVSLGTAIVITAAVLLVVSLTLILNNRNVLMYTQNEFRLIFTGEDNVDVYNKGSIYAGKYVQVSENKAHVMTQFGTLELETTRNTKTNKIKDLRTGKMLYTKLEATITKWTPAKEFLYNLLKYSLLLVFTLASILGAAVLTNFINSREVPEDTEKVKQKEEYVPPTKAIPRNK